MDLGISKIDAAKLMQRLYAAPLKRRRIYADNHYFKVTTLVAYDEDEVVEFCENKIHLPYMADFLKKIRKVRKKREKELAKAQSSLKNTAITQALNNQARC
jgi:uncharacterized protein YgbK (DUF1537 family)